MGQRNPGIPGHGLAGLYFAGGQRPHPAGDRPVAGDPAPDGHAGHHAAPAKHGRKLMQADRSHLHHTLLDLGFSPRQTLVVLIVYATACALLGKSLEGIAEYLSLALLLLLFPRPLPVRHAGRGHRQVPGAPSQDSHGPALDPATVAIHPVAEYLVQGVGGAPQVAHPGQPARHHGRSGSGAGSRWGWNNLQAARGEQGF